MRETVLKIGESGKGVLSFVRDLNRTEIDDLSSRA